MNQLESKENEINVNQSKPWKTWQKALVIIGVLIAVFYYAFNRNEGTKYNSNKYYPGSKAESSEDINSPDYTSDKISKSSSQLEVIRLNDTLRTEYFDIVASHAFVTDLIKTGYSNKRAEKGERYLVFTAYFKNMDNESRMVESGEVLVNFNGRDYSFDEPEQIMANGYGVFLDQINPLTYKKTKLVYKIPDNLSGELYWHPGRSSNGKLIHLGNLKQ